MTFWQWSGKYIRGLKAGEYLKIILALLIFSLIVIIHELGHFLLAKKNDIAVTEFSLGMGPRLFSTVKGETRYSIKLLPFGGSCLMVGEDEESDDVNAFNNKSVFARISVVFAGPLFNFLLAFVLSIFIVGSIGYDAPVVWKISEGYPAETAGMEAGDKIIRLNDTRIHVYREVSLFVQLNQKNGASPVEVEYERDGERYTVSLTPRQAENGMYYLGFTGSGVRTKGGPLITLKYSAYEVKYWISTTLKSLGMLFEGQVSADDVSGPVGIVNIIGDTYEESKSDGAFYVWLNMLNIAILLSANLGVMNLLPIPALDGGRLVFLIIEAIRGKAIDPEKEGMIHMIGLMALMVLMVFVMFNDIRQIFW